MRKRTITRNLCLSVVVLMLMALMLTACSDTGYSKEGLVTLKDSKEGICTVQIAEIKTKKKKDKTIVYLRGTPDYTMADYKLRKKGYSWKIHIGVELMDANGNRVEPTTVNPYMMGSGSGNAASYWFDGRGYTGAYVYHVDNRANGVEVPFEELEIPKEYKMSKLVRKLE